MLLANGRPDLPPDHPMTPYAQHVVDELAFQHDMMWIILVMKFVMIGVAAAALVSFLSWRRAAKRQEEAEKAKAKALDEQIATNRQLVVRNEELLTLARGWVGVGEQERRDAERVAERAKIEAARIAEQAKREAIQKAEEITREIRKVPDATADKTADRVMERMDAHRPDGVPPSGTFKKPNGIPPPD